MGQGFQDMGPAMKAFETLAANGKIRHGNHPLLRWCFANAVVVRDAADGHKLDKSKSYGRIDVAVAAIMAVGALKATTAEPEYEIASMIG
jgi:phage terminase large subunit-like protein